MKELIDFYKVQTDNFNDFNMAMFFMKSIDSAAINSEDRLNAFTSVLAFLYYLLKDKILIPTYSIYIYAFRKILNHNNDFSHNLLDKLLLFSNDADDI